MSFKPGDLVTCVGTTAIWTVKEVVTDRYTLVEADIYKFGKWGEEYIKWLVCEATYSTDGKKYDEPIVTRLSVELCEKLTPEIIDIMFITPHYDAISRFMAIRDICLLNEASQS